MGRNNEDCFPWRSTGLLEYQTDLHLVWFQTPTGSSNRQRRGKQMSGKLQLNYSLITKQLMIAGERKKERIGEQNEERRSEGLTGREDRRERRKGEQKGRRDAQRLTDGFEKRKLKGREESALINDSGQDLYKKKKRREKLERISTVSLLLLKTSSTGFISTSGLLDSFCWLQMIFLSTCLLLWIVGKFFVPHTTSSFL